MSEENSLNDDIEFQCAKCEKIFEITEFNAIVFRGRGVRLYVSDLCDGCYVKALSEYDAFIRS